MNDEEVFALLRSGVPEAMEDLVERYYGPLRGYFMRMLRGNLAEAEDLAQETFLRVLRYRGAPPRCFKAWLYTIARNLVYDKYRSAPYRHEQVGASGDLLDEMDQNDFRLDPVESIESVEETFMKQDRAESITAILAHLPDNQRELIILRFYQGLKLEEIAQITGSPLGTVKSRLFHGLERLKVLFKEVEYDAK